MAKICPNCGLANRDNARFCSSCATPLVQELICPSCGTRNMPTARFCHQCATPLASATYPVGLGTGLLSPNSMLAGRYIIVQKVGQGGMGAVYQATDTRLGHKLVAVKEMSDTAITDPLEKQQVRQAFEREAQMLATLNHPNLPRVTDHFSETGKQYLVMDFIEGLTLEEVLNQTPGFLGEKQVVDWGVQLCEVLDYLHHQRPPVIFRDLKPANIMLDREGKVKLIDFGIARLFKLGKTTDTASFGTAGYAPPEQYGKGQTDARSDIYALGATLHHLLTRRDPTQTPFSFPPVRSLSSKVSKAVDQVISRAVEQDPDQRWQTAREMQRALVSPQPAAPVPAPVSAPAVVTPQPAAAVKPAPSPTPAPTAVTRASTGRFLATVVITAGVFTTINAKVLLPLFMRHYSTLLYGLFMATSLVSTPLAYMLTGRPGAVLLTSGLSAIMYSVLQGDSLSLWGLIPAAVMEGIFAIRSYKRHDYWTVMLATVLSSIVSLGVTFIRWSYFPPANWIAVNLTGAFIAGSIAYAIGRVLGRR
jgi:serine/threonine-protein kinase